MLDETEIESQSALDPRAGRVDVVMPEIKFNPLEIVSQLEDLKYKKFTRVRNRKCIDRIVTTYTKYAGGVFPIGIQRIKVDRDGLEVPDVEEKAEELLEFENELYGKQRELKKINKRKRKKIVSNQALFDEFQAKSNKIAKIKQDANAWTEEDITEETVTEPPAKKSKKSKKVESKVADSTGKSPKSAKKHKSSEWQEPLADGEVEYFIPSKKQQLNGVPRVTKTAESVTEHVITPKSGKPKVNGVEKIASVENETPKKSPKVKKFKADEAPVANGLEKSESADINETPKKSPKVKKSKAEIVTPVTSAKVAKTPESVKPTTPEPNSSSKLASDKKVKSTSKLAQSKTSTPNIFVDKATPTSSAEKRVKIALKMNQSQEVTEYIRQLKQSPHPYDSAKKPSKGVLKPNLAPSPINPFYKRLIGIE